MIIFFLFLISRAYLKLLLIDKPKLDIISIARSKLKMPPLLHSTINNNHADTENVSFFPLSSSSSSSMNTATSYNYTLSHKYSFNIPNPSYVQILKDGFLSVTSFSFLKKGSINQFDIGSNSNSNNNHSSGSRSGIVSNSSKHVQDNNSNSNRNFDSDSDESNNDNNDSNDNDDSVSSSRNCNSNSKTKTKISNHSNPPPHSTSISQLTHSKRYNGEYLWPNELTSFQDLSGNKMTIIPDGFLFPGQDDGGLYMIQELPAPASLPQSSSSVSSPLSSLESSGVELDSINILEENGDKTTTTTTTTNNNNHSHRQHRTSLLSSIEAEAAAEAAAQFPIRITANKKGWFYHRAVYVRLPIPETTTDTPPRRYREGILTARAYKPLFGRGRGELVWINLPTATATDSVNTNGKKGKKSRSEATDVMSESTTNGRNINNNMENDTNDDEEGEEGDIDEWIPWQETVLVEGPDVMFETVDIDPNDNSIEIISAHFFGQKITVHSLEAVPSLSSHGTTLKSSLAKNTLSSSYSSSFLSSGNKKKQIIKQRRRPLIKISDTYLLDNAVGQPYGLCLASMPSLTLQQSSSSSLLESPESAAVVVSPLPQQQQQSQVDSRALFTMQSDISPHTTTSSNSGGNSAGRGQVGLRASNKKKVATTTAIAQLNVHSSDSRSISTSIDAKSTSVTQVPLSLSPTTTATVTAATATAPPSSRISSNTVASALPVATPSVYTHLLVTTHECSYDIWSTIKMAVLAVFGRYPRIRAGAAVQHEYSRRYLGRSRSGGATTNSNGIIGSVDGGTISSSFSSSINGINSDTCVDLLSSSTTAVTTENMMRSRSESTTNNNKDNNDDDNYTTNHNQKQCTQTSPRQNNHSRWKGLWSGVGESFFGSGGNLFGVESMFFSSVGKQLASSKAGVGGSLFAYELPRLRRPNSSSTTTTTSSSSSSIGQQTTTNNDSQFKSYIPSSIEHSINSKSSSSPSTSNNIVQEVIDTYDTPRSLSWRRHTLCTGFKVKGWGGIFSPGAPGFPYVFNMPNSQSQAVSSSSSSDSKNGVATDGTTTSTVPPMPLILVAGDCTGSAYIFTPRTSGSSASAVSVANNNNNNKSVTTVNVASTSHTISTSSTVSLTTRKSTTRKSTKKGNKSKVVKDTVDVDVNDKEEEEEEEEVLLAPVYDLAFEIECGATVGSAAAALATDGTNSVDIFLPSYELNQIHALRLSLNEHPQQ